MIIKILPIQTGSAGKVEVTEGDLALSEEIKKRATLPHAIPVEPDFTCDHLSSA